MSKASALLIVFAWLIAVPAAAVPQPERCTGPRQVFQYPVVLKGLKAPVGQPVGLFAAWALKAGHFVRVAVQVEEVNSQGDYVLSGGLPYTRGTGSGLFNERDEMVFAGEDFGEHFTARDLPADIRRQLRSGWAVDFCNGEHYLGSLWVGALRVQAAFAPRPAVRFNRALNEVETDVYSYKFAPKNPVLLGEVGLRHDHKLAPAIAKSVFLMPLKTPFFLPDMTFSADDLTSEVESWQDGPLRTIVAVGVKYSAFLSLFKLHLFSELVFYKNRFVIPTVIQFVFDPAQYLSAGSGVAYALSFPPGTPWTVQANLEPLPAQAPEAALAAAKPATWTDEFHALAQSANGSFLVSVRVDPKARVGVPSPFLLNAADLHSPEQSRHWPWLAALGGGDLGVFLDFSKIHAGTYHFGLDLLVSPKANESFTDYGQVGSFWQALPAL